MHARFYFLNRISLSQIQGNTCFFQRFLYPTSFFRSAILNPLQYVWPWPNLHQPLFAFCHNQIQHLLPLSTSSREFEECPNIAVDHTLGLSVKISRCRHLQNIIVNWLVSLLSLLRQQSLLLIDYIYFNKSKSYAWDMQAKLKERKIILENFSALRKER